MRPSQAMGLFLRTWRVEWAELSRTQLARLLVRAGASRVTAHAVRAWELGQPPHDLVELDGLCECMKRHGLSTLEAGQFREIVFAACLDRQYDGLFEDEPLTSRADLDECAQVMASTLTRDPREASLPALIAAQHELDQSLSVAFSGHISLAQRRRQVAARIIIGYALGWHYLGCARWAAAARQLRTSEDLLRRFYGMQGLGPGPRAGSARLGDPR
ncbi:MAG: hypothetical protein HPY69_19935 [Armatimonadetes bacterium]|nr:hypothetical protein [Armatimonadota bacterium]